MAGSWLEKERLKAFYFSSKLPATLSIFEPYLVDIWNGEPQTGRVIFRCGWSACAACCSKSRCWQRVGPSAGSLWKSNPRASRI